LNMQISYIGEKMKIHYMKLKPQPYDLIKVGYKDIEMRLNDEKRQAINPGDIIEFTNTESGEIIKVIVLNKHNFKSFTELYNAFDKTRLGYSQNEIGTPEDMEKYYPVDEIAINGVVGIEIQLI